MMVKIISRFISWVIRTFYLRQVTGKEHLQNIQGSIILANHASYLDHFVILAVLEGSIERKKIYFLTKKEAFRRPISKWWHQMMQGIPLDRDGQATESLRAMAQHLKQGDVVVLYPEGTRTRTGLIGAGNEGAASIANRTGAPILTIGIKGTFDVLPAKHLWPRKANVSVAIGQARQLAFKGSTQRKKETQRLMDDIASLSGEYVSDAQLKGDVQVARFYNTIGIRRFVDLKIEPLYAFQRARLLMLNHLRNNPFDEEGWLELGISYGRLFLMSRSFRKRYRYQRLSFKALKKALALNGRNDGALYAMGRLHYEKRHYQHARYFYERSLHVNSQNSASRTWLIRVYQKLGLFELANQMAKVTVELPSSNQVSQRRRLEAVAFAMRLNKKNDFVIEGEKRL